jgi:leucyl aminopeptidase
MDLPIPAVVLFVLINPPGKAMRIVPSLATADQVPADWLAVGVFEGKADPRVTPPESPLGVALARLIASKDLAGSVGETLPLFGVGGAGGSVLAFGLGSSDSLEPGAAYSAGLAVGKRLASKPRKAVAVALPSLDSEAVASALVEGVLVGMRGPGVRKSEPTRHAFEELRVVGVPGGPFSSETLRRIAGRAEVVADAVNLARDLVNTPPSEKPPAVLAERIRQAAESAGVSAEVWERDRIVAERFGGLLGVAAGSSQPPRFVVLRYRSVPEGPSVALVGKGVTFDSGGLSLKPSTSMEDMKADMTGAAVVASTVLAAARLGLRVNLDGYLALTENMTGGAAMKLGDVLTMRNGVTVEVMNTDAEGRLILADALAYAAEARPDCMIDLATLTGACMVALGPKVAGLFGNDEALAGDLIDATRRTGERAWRMPLHDDYEEQLKSSVADCKNVGGKYGGAITAAKFLQKFVAGVPWAHLDIAGPSWADSENGSRDAGGTGCFVRTLVALLEAWKRD